MQHISSTVDFKDKSHELEAVGYGKWPRCVPCHDWGELDTKSYTLCPHCEGKHKEEYLDALDRVTAIYTARALASVGYFGWPKCKACFDWGDPQRECSACRGIYKKEVSRASIAVRDAENRKRDTEDRVRGANDALQPFELNRAERLTKRQQVVALLGGGCFVCGEKRFAALQIDHIHDDGAQHRQTKTGRGPAFLDDVLRLGFTEYQLLCGTCHVLKTAEAREQRTRGTT